MAPWLLVACGGGGGGNSATLAPFVKFSSIVIPSSVRISGASQEATYTYNTATQSVSSVSSPSAFTSGATYDGTYSRPGVVSKATFRSATGASVISIDTSRGDQVAGDYALTKFVTVNGQDYGLLVNPYDTGWNYQTAGVWVTGGGTGSGSAGAATVGSETVGTAIPTNGMGTYSGRTLGFYVPSSGTPYYTTSQVIANAFFGARAITFETINSATLNQNTLAQTRNTNLDLSGTLSYIAGSNQFSGTVSSRGGGASNAPMAGTATGKFYGPSAQEIGGTFALHNGSTYLGAFGGYGSYCGSCIPVLAPFVKFSSIELPSTVRIKGFSQEVAYTFNTGTGLVTSASSPTSFGPATFDGTYNSGNILTKAVFTSNAGTNLTIDTASGGSFTSIGPISGAESANGQSTAISIIPSAVGWDYQTFGVWTTGVGTGSGRAGAATFGAETSGAAIPTTGTGIYTGGTLGQYVSSSGVPFSTVSNMSASANFSTRSITFVTTNTEAANVITGVSATNSNLNLTGSLTYSAGVNQFTGSVNSVGGGTSNAAMTGTATGKFYGPTAQEIGGTFTLSNGASYLGAFGGKR